MRFDIFVLQANEKIDTCCSDVVKKRSEFRKERDFEIRERYIWDTREQHGRYHTVAPIQMTMQTDSDTDGQTQTFQQLYYYRY